jgi:hypothetical protein
MTRITRLLASAALALTAIAPATAPAQTAAVTEARAQLILLAQSFDGSITRSFSRTAATAEARRGDDRWLLVNYGEGSLVRRGDGRIAGANVANASDVELGLSFDASTREVSGDAHLARIINDHVRPLADRAPPGAASWTLRFTPAELGIDGPTAAALTVRFTRRSITHAGRALELVEYQLPGFSYVDADGLGVAQWGRGGVLRDPASGALLWSGSTHRAVTGDAGAARPYRAVLSAVTVDAAGKPLLNTAAVAELQPLLTALYGKAAAAPLPFASDSNRIPSQTPLHLAAMIDMVALTAAEAGFGAHSAALSGFLLGRTGDNRAVAPTPRSGDSK